MRRRSEEEADLTRPRGSLNPPDVTAERKRARDGGREGEGGGGVNIRATRVSHRQCCRSFGANRCKTECLVTGAASLDPVRAATLLGLIGSDSAKVINRFKCSGHVGNGPRKSSAEFGDAPDSRETFPFDHPQIRSQGALIIEQPVYHNFSLFRLIKCHHFEWSAYKIKFNLQSLITQEAATAKGTSKQRGSMETFLVSRQQLFEHPLSVVTRLRGTSSFQS